MLEAFGPAKKFADKIKKLVTSSKSEGRGNDTSKALISEIKSNISKIQDPNDKKNAESLLNRAEKAAERLSKYDEAQSKELYNKFLNEIKNKPEDKIEEIYNQYAYKMELLVSGYNAQLDDITMARDKVYHLATGKFYGEAYTDLLAPDTLEFIYECFDAVDDAKIIHSFGNINYEIISQVNSMRASISNIPEHIKNRDFNELNQDVLAAIKTLDVLITNINDADCCEPGYYNKMLRDIIIPTVALFTTVVRNNSNLTLSSLQPLYESLKDDLKEFDIISENNLISNPFVYKYKDKLIHDITDFKGILGDFSDNIYALFEAKKDILDREVFDDVIESVDNRSLEKVKEKLYNECANGTITIYEREEKLQDIKDTKYLAGIISRDIYESKTKKDFYNGLVKVLYEKCAAGELSFDERERLVMKAKRELITESEEKIPAANDTTMGKEPDEKKTKQNQEKATNDFEKNLDNDIKVD